MLIFYAILYQSDDFCVVRANPISFYGMKLRFRMQFQFQLNGNGIGNWNWNCDRLGRLFETLNLNGLFLADNYVC